MSKYDLSSLPIVDETSEYNPNLMVRKAKGNSIWFENDKEAFFDLTMGYSSTNFGHNNPEIVRLVKLALKKADNIPAFNFKERLSLSKQILSHLPFDASNYQVYYPVGGAKAIEAALKLARLYTKRTYVLSFKGGFHGYSTSAMGVTDQDFFNPSYSIFKHDVVHLDFPDLNKGNKYKDTLNDLIKTIKKEKISAVIVETVQGASGFRQADRRFFKELRKVTKTHNVLLIIDEIQAGIGRTGGFFSFGRFDIEPDIILLGKSLAGGFYPLSAVIARKEYFDTIGSEKTAFDSTFSNNIFGITIADGVLKYMKRSNILEKVHKQEILFKKMMFDLKDRHPLLIKNISIIGLACAWELEKNNIAQKIEQEAFRDHIIIQVAGVQGNYIKLSPALTIRDNDLKSVCKKLDNVLFRIETRL